MASCFIRLRANGGFNQRFLRFNLEKAVIHEPQEKTNKFKYLPLLMLAPDG
jgi:hypothetical protein